MARRRNKRRRNAGGKRKRRGGQNSRPQNFTGLLAIPPRVNGVKLKYQADLVLNNATVLNPYCYTYLNLSNPLIVGAGAPSVVPYMAIYTQLYRKFRVRKFRVLVRFGNAEAYFINAFITPFNYLPPNTAASNKAAFSNILTKKKMISPKSGVDKATVVMTSSIMQLAGFASTNVEDNYVGNTDGSSAPSDNVYALVSVDTDTAASVAGVLAEIEVTFWIDFIERNTPAA